MALLHISPSLSPLPFCTVGSLHPRLPSPLLWNDRCNKSRPCEPWLTHHSIRDPPIRIHFRPRCIDEIQHQTTVKMSSDSLAFFSLPFFLYCVARGRNIKTAAPENLWHVTAAQSSSCLLLRLHFLYNIVAHFPHSYMLLLFCIKIW